MKRVLITGGGSGIGAATARQLANSGAAVTICGRTAASLDATIRSIGAVAQPMKRALVDVTDETQVVRLFQEHVFDAIVCAAGTIKTANVFDLSLEDFEQVLRTNLTGTYLICREAMRQMRANQLPGDIVTIASLAGIRGMQVRFPGSFAYVASKHAVAGLSEALAIDGRPYGIRINCVSPGRVDTAMSRQFGGIPEIKPEAVAAFIESLLDAKRTGVISGANIEVYSHD